MDPHTDLQNPVQSPPQEPVSPPDSDGPSLATTPEVTDGVDAGTPKKQFNKELRALGQTFGNIPGVPIFTQWRTRKDCCDAAVHRPPQAGISGNKEDGVFSVVMSGKYEDVDEGDVVIYSGTGGGYTHPTKPIWDQSWDWAQNKALKASIGSENPVRVIRSSKCGSKYAPLEGLRYDGLYTIADGWMGKGHKGNNVCFCRLERLPDQPPIPSRPTTFFD